MLASAAIGWTRARSVWPGISLCGVVGLAAAFLSSHYGGPQLLYALLLGLALNFLSAHASLDAGITFTSKTLLRLGVALLGARITLEQVSGLGMRTALVVLLAVVATIGVALVLAPALQRTRDEGWISGVAVAICGASAAMAVAAVLPQTRSNERYTLLTIVAVTLLSTVAMVVYPMAASMLHATSAQAGIFLGATIHDVAQVVAAGTLLGPEARDTATVVKLLRVAMLAPVVVVVALVARTRASGECGASGTGKRPPLIPGFLIGFIALVGLASTDMLPHAAGEAASALSRTFLVMALAAAGIRTRLQELATLGWKPIILLTSETLFLAFLAGGLVLF